MENEIVNYGKHSLADKMTKFETMLLSMGLPSNNVIASLDERENIMNLLPTVIEKLPPEQKRNAMYLSRFVAGAAIGLFDAALNYIWDEVVVNLREKIVFYGLDIFFDNTVPDKVREQYKTKEDLSGIKDKTMLETCKKLEWISDIVYRKLCHILDMRNQIGASHPNSYNINSYELIGWLQTCITEVINDSPSTSAIQVKKIVENVKMKKDPIDKLTLESIEDATKDFSSHMVSNLLKSLFGIYVADKTENDVRKNILLLSKVIWKYCNEETKYDIGEKKAFYKNNLEEEKDKLTQVFLENCRGLPYLTLSEKSLKLSSLCDDLYSANIGWNNYYTEPPIAKEIMKYINTSDDIPKDREEKIINTIVVCRIGREVSYCHGVSSGAKAFYDKFLKLLSKEQVIVLLSGLKPIFESIYDDGIRTENAKDILKMIKSPILGDRVNEIIDYMLNSYQNENLHNVFMDQGFKEICNGIIEIR